MPGDYRNLADEARQIHYTLQDIEDTIAPRPLEVGKQTELNEHLQACDQVLNDLNALLDKYNGLSAQSKRTWDRLSWDQEGARDIETNLKKTITQLSAFYKSVKDSPQAQIERALEQLAEEISNGRHETSSVTTLSTASDYDDDSGWIQVMRDLGDLGLEQSIVSEYRSFIVDWILKAINSGVLTEKIPVEENNAPEVVLPPPIPPKIPSPMHSGPLAPPSMEYYSQPSSSYSNIPQPFNSYNNTAPASHRYNNLPELRPAVSYDVFSHERQISSVSMNDEPPSPIEPEPAESNIVWTAQRIVESWGKRDWSSAKTHLEEQISAVERGEYVEMGGFPVQPDLRILRHLLGVCYSFSGDFLKAKEEFEKVLQGVYIQGTPLDDGDIAAARWLGETCICLNQPFNAALAWAISFHGLIVKYPLHNTANNLSYRMLEDLRFLNQKSNGLNGLRNHVVKSNKDVSTILPRMRGTDKFQIVLSAINSSSIFQNRAPQTLHLPQDISLAEGFLIQPLVAQNSWPFPQDPFFRIGSSIQLLAVLSRPRQEFVLGGVQTSSLGSSKNLTFVTKQPLKWLVEAVKFALNTYAIEWKVQGSTYLLRLSQQHERVAYYDCFGIKFRKLSLRSVYGIKLTEAMYVTRGFSTSRFALPQDTIGAVLSEGETARKEIIRKELADRLKGYLEQAEKDVLAGKPWPPVDAPMIRAPYELQGMAHSQYAELSAASAGPVSGGPVAAELPGEAARKRQSQMPSYEIAELPAEPFH
jgi:hypothetical protein